MKLLKSNSNYLEQIPTKKKPKSNIKNDEDLKIQNANNFNDNYLGFIRLNFGRDTHLFGLVLHPSLKHLMCFTSKTLCTSLTI